MNELVGKLKNKANFYRQEIQSLFRNRQLRKEARKYDLSYLQKGIYMPAKWYGSVYGGFYVIPSLLNEHSIVYSFGLGKDISFDLKIIKKHHSKVFGFDPTPKSIQWVKEQKLPPEFNFYEFGISHVSGEVDFYLPRNDKAVSGSIEQISVTDPSKHIKVSMQTIMEIAKELGHAHIDILKMDIEGAEYEVLKSVLISPITIDQILVEFHDRYFEGGRKKTKKIVNLMRENDYEIFGISSSYEEVSFLHKRKWRSI